MHTEATTSSFPDSHLYRSQTDVLVRKYIISFVFVCGPALSAMLSSLLVLSLASAFLGIASHLTYFISARHLFHHCTLIFFCFLLTPIASLIVFIRFAHYPLQDALSIVGVIWWSFTGALWLSMSVYRAFFHRLGGYPGPFLARLTQLWRVWKNLRGEHYRVLDELHRKYGEYVRVGMCW